MTVSLKLVGPRSYTCPQLLSRPIQRGETIDNVPEAIADKLLAKGHGEGDDFRPFFKEIHTRRPARVSRPEPVAEIDEDVVQAPKPQKEAKADKEDDAPVEEAPKARRASKTAVQRKARTTS